ncbi:hypothetical protein [Acinetobacter sp.]|uniref:hypothetical protein n=1 Tax=Acinetobacter sp. TaxID=472 RepID=UPI00388EC544
MATTPQDAKNDNQASTVKATAEVAGKEVNRGTAATDAVAKSTSTASGDDVKKDIDAGREEEQKVGAELDAANSKSDYFQQVANDDAVFNDPTRQEHQRMRAQEQEAKKGDPTRDPVAKQEAMDMNTPQPGAAEEAEEINQGADKAKRQK